jgi:hypothetical protein
MGTAFEILKHLFYAAIGLLVVLIFITLVVKMTGKVSPSVQGGIRNVTNFAGLND